MRYDQVLIDTKGIPSKELTIRLSSLKAGKEILNIRQLIFHIEDLQPVNIDVSLNGTEH